MSVERSLLSVAWLAVPLLVGCAPSFDEDDACDKATAYITTNHIWVTTETSVYAPSVEGCSDFWTRESDGSAGNSVYVGYEPDDGGVYAGAEVDCYFFETDQGWNLQECIPQF
jgi:hypothetical protein